MSDMDTSAIIDPAANDFLERFPSLASLRAAHGELVRKRRHSGATPAFLDEVAIFIQRGAATGALLDASTDRRASQSLLDYWANALYRIGREPPEPTLAEFDPVLAPELDDALCPYLGLDAFGEAHHKVFFGRQRLVDEMVSRLRENRLLAVLGPSGSGKSSAVLAGLLPSLKAGVISGSQNWRYAPPMVPGSNPLANLARLLWPAGAQVAEWIQRQVEHLLQSTDHVLQRIDGLADGPVVLVIDQFEEIFTLCNDDQTRQAFMNNLLSLLQTADIRHTVILTMRIDFEPQVARLPRFHPLFEEAQVRVTPLSAGELREAIEGPAELVGLRFEEGLVDALLQDILGEPAALPLLQFTLLKLWENRERNRVTWEAYRRLGGGRLALARSADEFYEGLIPEEQVTARRILLRMVRPGEGLEVTSNRIRHETLYRAGEARDRIDRVLARLVQARLVRLTESDTPADDQVEVAHEALVRNWPRLVDWLEDEREAMRRRLRLTAAAEQWATLDRDPEALWRGTLLNEALRYQELNDLETEFVQASQAAIKSEQEREIVRQRELARAQALAEAEQRRTKERTRTSRHLRRLAEEQARAAEELTRSARRLRLLLFALGVMFLLVAMAAVLARRWADQAEASEELADAQAVQAVAAQETAEAERDRAEKQLRLSTSRKLAAVAINNLDIDPERSILLALEAASAIYSAHRMVTDEAEDGLHRAVQASRVQLALAGHASDVNGVAFSPDGTRLATASGDRTAKIWDTASGKELLTLSGHTGWVRDVVFSPDGMRLATASNDKTAKIWDAASGQELLTLSGHTEIVWSAAFSPDGTRLATASGDDSAKVWDANTGRELFSLASHANDVSDISFSPDGERLATASHDRVVKVWNANTGRELLTLSGHTSEVYGVTFSSDGTRLATVGRGSAVKVWNVAAGEELFTLTRHTNTVFDVAFYGTRLATASADRTVKVWDATSRGELLTLYGHTGVVQSVAFSPDGTRLATASRDGTARVWNVSASQELFTLSDHADEIGSVAFSPDGTLLATASGDGTVKVWDAISGENLSTIFSHTSDGTGVAFSPDGTRLATAHRSTAKVWDVASGQELLTLFGHDAWVYNVAFSPDGTRLATASSDNTAKVWDVASGEELFNLSGHNDWVFDITFSPDGTRLATTSEDRTAKVWDVDSGEELLTFSGHNDFVFGVAFSPDGRHLATTARDGITKVWDIASGEEMFTLSGHTNAVHDVVFSLDGSRLATASWDRTAKVWDATSGGELLTLYGHTDAVQSVAFSPDGTRLATASDDGTARLYILDIEELMMLACSRVTRNLTFDEWEMYLGRDIPYRRTCLSLPAHPSVIQAVMARGQEHTREGQINEALAVLNLALELDPALGLDPEAEVLQILAQQGREYAYEGEYDNALAILHQADKLDLQIETSRLWDLTDAYNMICQRGSSEDLSETILAACERAVELAISTDDAYLNREICQNARFDGLMDIVSPACERAVELAIGTDDAYLNNEVCQNGSIDGLVETVLPACERAVKLAVKTDNWSLNNRICQNGRIDRLMESVLPACERAVELGIETDDPYINNEICQNTRIDRLMEIILPACKRAVELALKMNDAYLNYKICMNRGIDGLSVIVSPVCERVDSMTIKMAFGETTTGTIEPGDRHIWVFEGTAGQIVTIAMSEDGSGLNTYLSLLGPDGATLADDNDGGKGTNSRIDRFILPKTGTCAIVARGFLDSAGAYTLTLIDETQ